MLKRNLLHRLKKIFKFGYFIEINSGILQIGIDKSVILGISLFNRRFIKLITALGVSCKTHI